MAFRKYSDPFAAPLPKTKTDRTFKSIDNNPPSPGWVRFGEAPVKAPTTAETKDQEAQLHKDLIMRAVFGDAGQKPGQSYDQRLKEEFDNPAMPQTEGEAHFRANPFAAEEDKAKVLQAVKPPKEDFAGDRSEEKVKRVTNNAYQMALTSFDPNGKGADWKTYFQSLAVSPQFRDADFSDPRFESLGRKFASEYKPKETIWGNFADKVKPAMASGGNFLSKLVSGKPKAEPAAPVAAPATSQDHNAALDWANANPNDPRASAIIQKAQMALRK